MEVARTVIGAALVAAAAACGAGDVGAAPGSDGDPRASSGADGGREPTARPDGGSDAASAPDGAAPVPLPPMPHPSFLVGYNEAWFGTKFGVDYTSGFDLAYVEKTLDGIVAGGGHLVRLWIWEVPQGVVLAPGSPRTQGLEPSFLANLDAVLLAARRRALWVYVTLLDGNTIAKIQGDLRPYGLALLNNTGGELDAWNDRALAPLLARLDARKDGIFGLDLVNEIQAAYGADVFPDRYAAPRAFIAKEAAFVKSRSPWLKVTASAGWPSDILQQGAQYDVSRGFLSGLGLDFYDVHAYEDSGAFPGATAMCARAASDGVPVYLGEFGQRSTALDDAKQLSATSAFLNNAKSLCFAGAFAWRWDAAEGARGYLRPDGSERPTVTPMKAFGAAP